MDNFFLNKKLESKKKKEDFNSKTNLNILRNRKGKNNNGSMKVQTRIDTWLHDNEVSVPILESYKKGALLLKNPIHHEFRSREKSLEKTKFGITVRSYEPAKERANNIENENLTFIMTRDEYDPNLPFKSDYLRERDIAKELTFPMRFGLNHRIENVRLREDIEKNRTLDNFERNMKMVHFPDWKETQKKKWLAQKDFLTTNCNFSQKKSYDPWAQLPIYNNGKSEKYFDGFESLGDVCRKSEPFDSKHFFQYDLETLKDYVRKKKIKSTQKPFISTSSTDIWRSTVDISRSIRTMKNDEVFKNDKNFDQFSKNGRKINYKTTLVESKSIDHIIPFNHSMNKNGNEFKNLRPTFPKIYWKSAIERIPNFKEINPVISDQNSPLEKKKSEISSNPYNKGIHEIMEEKEKSPENTMKSPTSSAKLRRLRKDNIYMNKEERIKSTLMSYFGPS